MANYNVTLISRTGDPLADEIARAARDLGCGYEQESANTANTDAHIAFTAGDLSELAYGLMTGGKIIIAIGNNLPGYARTLEDTIAVFKSIIETENTANNTDNIENTRILVTFQPVNTQDDWPPYEDFAFDVHDLIVAGIKNAYDDKV